MSLSYFDYDSLQKWFGDNGDKTHRLNYELNENSLVFDLGGFEGGWSYDIVQKFNCNVYVFEPVKIYYEKIVDRFKDNIKVRVFNIGLSNKNEFVDIFYNGDSSSMVFKTSTVEKIKIKNICDFLDDNNINKIDLIKINIEGAEFDLLDEVIERGYQTKFDNIQVQFHKMFNDCYERRDAIRKKLSETHHLTYDYKFVWENWKKNNL
jgi:FkbM family methyltransferase